MKTTKIICDQCNKDLQVGRAPVTRIWLSVKAVVSEAHTIYSVKVKPDIEQDCHFCSFKCLRNWALNKCPMQGYSE